MHEKSGKLAYCSLRLPPLVDLHVCATDDWMASQGNAVRPEDAQELLARPLAQNFSTEKCGSSYDETRYRIHIRRNDLITQRLVECFVRIQHERPARPDLSQRKQARVQKSPPLAENDRRPVRMRYLCRTICRPSVNDQYGAPRWNAFKRPP